MYIQLMNCNKTNFKLDWKRNQMYQKKKKPSHASWVIWCKKIVTLTGFRSLLSNCAGVLQKWAHQGQEHISTNNFPHPPPHIPPSPPKTIVPSKPVTQLNSYLAVTSSFKKLLLIYISYQLLYLLFSLPDKKKNLANRQVYTQSHLHFKPF